MYKLINKNDGFVARRRALRAPGGLKEQYVGQLKAAPLKTAGATIGVAVAPIVVSKILGYIWTNTVGHALGVARRERQDRRNRRIMDARAGTTPEEHEKMTGERAEDLAVHEI